MLDFPEYSPELFVDRARAQVRDRNHFGSHRVFEIRRRAGRVRRAEGYLLALFISPNGRLPKRSALIKTATIWLLPCRQILSLEILNEPFLDFLRLVEFHGRFLNLGTGA